MPVDHKMPSVQNLPFPTGPELPPDPNAKPAPVITEQPTPEAKPAAEEIKQQEQKEEAQQAEQKQVAQQDAEGAEQPADVRTRLGQTARQRAETNQSQFRRDSSSEKGAQLPQQFGRKINVSSEAARMLENAAHREGSDGPLLQRPDVQKMLAEKFPRMLPWPPKPTLQDIKTLLNSNNFKNGPLKDTPLHKNLMEMMHEAQKQTGEARIMKDVPEKVLERGEIAQLFRMRNNTEEKDALRNVLRYSAAAAKQEQRARQVQAIRQETEGHHQNEELAQTKKTMFSELDSVWQKIANRLTKSQEQSGFEKTLQDALISGKKTVPNLPQNVRAKALPKTDSEWNEFFQNAKNLDSEELKTLAKLADIQDAMFRGTFKKAGTGQQMLVADLAMAEEGELANNKFAQLLLKDQGLAELLNKMPPGSQIPTELLQKLGNEIELLKLVHMIQSTDLSEAQKQEILKAYKQQHSAESQKRLEYALIGQREERKDKEKENNPPFVYAGQINPKIEEAPRIPRPFLFLLLAVLGITIAVIMYILVKYSS